MIRILSIYFLIIASCFVNYCDGFAAAIADAKAAIGNSFGSAIGSAVGSNQASAFASALATNNFAFSKVTASASSGGQYHPAPYHCKPTPYYSRPTPYHPKPAPYYPNPHTPKSHPVYYPQPSKSHPAPVVVVTKPSRKVYIDYKKCGDMKYCYDLDKYSNCGYCQETHHGYGCSYDIVHGTDYVPKCSCKGRFIYKKSDCY